MAKVYSPNSRLENLGDLRANESGPPDDRGNGLPVAARAFLDTLAGPESGGDYNIIYRGDHFNSYDDHPKVWVNINSGPIAKKDRYSSAAGKYQFIEPTWKAASKLAGVTDFSPASQDKAAWALAQQTYRRSTGRDLLTDLQSGDPAIQAGIPGALSSEWDSLPGGGQPGTTANQFMQTLNGHIERLTGHPVPPGGMASDPPVPLTREAGAAAREGYAPAAPPVPQPAYMGDVARANSGYQKPSLDMLPMPPPGIAPQPKPFVSEDHPNSNRPASTAPGLGQSFVRPAAAPAGMPAARQPVQNYVRPAAAAAGMPFAKGPISGGNPMAEPQQPATPAKPASKSPGNFTYDPGNGQGTVLLPGRPASVAPPPTAAAAGQKVAAAAASVPKYITTKVPIAPTKPAAAYGPPTKPAAMLGAGMVGGASGAGTMIAGRPEGPAPTGLPAAKPAEVPPPAEFKTVVTLNPEWQKQQDQIKRQQQPGLGGGGGTSYGGGSESQVVLASGKSAPVGLTTKIGNYTYQVQQDGSVKNTTTGKTSAKAQGSSGGQKTWFQQVTGG